MPIQTAFFCWSTRDTTAVRASFLNFIVETKLMFTLDTLADNAIVSSTCTILTCRCVPKIMFIINLITFTTIETTHMSIGTHRTTTVRQANRFLILFVIKRKKISNCKDEVDRLTELQCKTGQISSVQMIDSLRHVQCVQLLFRVQTSPF
jgi:hypothetical protein